MVKINIINHLEPKLITVTTTNMVLLIYEYKAKLVIELEVFYHLLEKYQDLPNSTSTTLKMKFTTEYNH